LPPYSPEFTHGAAVEIPEFSLDFIHWVHKTSVVRGARPKPDVPVRRALGGIKNAVRKEGLTDEPLIDRC